MPNNVDVVVLMARVWFQGGCWWCSLSDGATRAFKGPSAFIHACQTAVAEFEIPALDASWDPAQEACNA